MTTEPEDVKRAVILAAGRGQRLDVQERPGPKCLLRFGGRTLLERQLRLLQNCGVPEVVVATGFAHEEIERELDRLDLPRPTLVRNERYELGSMLTVDVVGPQLTAGGAVLLMDADVLCDARVLAPLVHAPSSTALLVDRDFEPGDEPVKVLLRAGVPVDLAKRPDLDLPHDAVGESVGFFRLSEAAATALAGIVRSSVDAGGAGLPHEDAVRDLLRAGEHPFAAVDVTGAPWTEIDFPEDVERARADVLPRLTTEV
ncbi:NTP transferase domain-containing protein [Pseudonocardia sp. RS11V-5]|uniref:phosphocholine cytidylyltransferase family protein n=1 Tax=Pseudonocardia terrae TaxID=2905831 RepID=UPI001E5E40A1|nr:NTP transferase domain-containing protein [Pseudonocardia terrae]MCE3553462.1 NTP transferase domain-containing protein [Pseudonocardia terrae]